MNDKTDTALELYHLLLRIQRPYARLKEYATDVKLARLFTESLGLPKFTVTPPVIVRPVIVRQTVVKFCINHPDKKAEYAGNLCRTCYGHNKRRQAGMAIYGHGKTCVNHPRAKHCAKGLCKICYDYKRKTGKDWPPEIHVKKMCVNHPDRPSGRSDTCTVCRDKKRRQGKATPRLQCVNHPDRYGGVSGFCEQCKDKNKYETNRYSWRNRVPKRTVHIPKMCKTHPDRVIVAHDMCMLCYKRKQRNADPCKFILS